MGTMIPYSRLKLHAVPAAPEPADQMRSELTAMRSIADTLDHLNDDESRARVLRWAAEFYHVSVVETATAAPVPAIALANTDPSLAVAGLESFFTHKGAGSTELETLFTFEKAEAHEPEADLFRDFEEMNTVHYGCEAPSFNDVHEAADAVQASNQPIESVIHSFVTDFQKLVNEWQNA